MPMNKKRPTLEDLKMFFDFPLEFVAKHFNIGRTLLKQICRKNGIKKWPYKRNIKVLGFENQSDIIFKKKKILEKRVFNVNRVRVDSIDFKLPPLLEEKEKSISELPSFKQFLDSIK
jgi:hypothetical protein